MDELEKTKAKLAKANETIKEQKEKARKIKEARLRNFMKELGEVSTTNLEDILQAGKIELDSREEGASSDIIEIQQLSDQIDEKYSKFGKFDGLSTGLGLLDDAIGGLKPSELTLIGGASNNGKQQRNTDIVPTPNGYRVWGDLQVGDRLFGSNGKPTTITHRFNDCVVDYYRVTFSDRSFIEVGGDHLFSFRRNNRPDRLIKARDLKPMYKYYLPLVEPLQYENNVPVPYAMGLYIADGYSHNSVMTIRKNDRAILEKTNPDRINEKPQYGCYYVDHPLQKAVREHGLFNVRSKDKFIPDAYLTANEKCRRELLQGLLDGDGSVIRKNTVYQTTSSRLADNVIELVTSLGGVARKTIINHPKGAYYRVSIRLRGVSVCTRYMKRTVIKVEYIGDFLGHCVQVDADDHLYVSDRQFNILTHNSALAINMAVYAASQSPTLFISLEMQPTSVGARIKHAFGDTYKDVKLYFQKEFKLDYRMLAPLIKNAYENYGVRCVFIDYLQYLGVGMENREVAKMSRVLSELCLQYNIPFIIVVSIRKQDTRSGKKWTDVELEDIMGTAAIGYDADNAILVSRQNPDCEYDPTGIWVKHLKSRDMSVNYENRYLRFNWDKTAITDDPEYAEKYKAEQNGVKPLHEISSDYSKKCLPVGKNESSKLKDELQPVSKNTSPEITKNIVPKYTNMTYYEQRQLGLNTLPGDKLSDDELKEIPF